MRNGLLRLLRELTRLEKDSQAGKANMAFMVAGLVLVLASSVSPWIEALVRIFKEDYTSGFPFLQVFVVWGVFCLICIFGIAMLERDRNEGP